MEREEQEEIINKLKEINTKMENLAIKMNDSLNKLIKLSNTEEYDRKG